MQGMTPVAWAYEACTDTSDWVKYLTFEKMPDSKYRRNFVPLYSLPSDGGQRTEFQCGYTAGIAAAKEGARLHAIPPQETLREVVEHYIADGHLQTFEDRERFRKAARAALDRMSAAEMPVAYACFTADGKIRLWSTDHAEIEGWAKTVGRTVTPLYTASDVLLPAGQAPEWQPIETAPEGVVVWGWQPPQNGLHDCYGTVELVEQEDGAWFTHHDGEETFTPTCWMPANKPRRPSTTKPLPSTTSRLVPANDCHDPSSCDRHNECMYLGCSAFAPQACQAGDK